MTIIPVVAKNNSNEIIFSGVIIRVLWYNYYTISKASLDVELVEVLEGLDAKSP